MLNDYDKVSQYGWDGLAAETAQSAAGDVYYVDENAGGAANNATSGQGDSWAAPFATINYAVSRCANDAGNVIFVAADHTEGITATATASGTTTTQLVIDKSGVTIIGLGTSDRRPTITVGTATTAEVYISATEVTLKNLLFKGNLEDLANIIEAVAGSSGLMIENCEFRDSGASLEVKDMIGLAADVDDIVIRGCRFIATDTASASQSAIAMAGGCDRGVIKDNYFHGDWGGGGYAVIEGGTAASVGILIDNNVIYNFDATKGEGITMHGDTTGFVTNNTIYTTNAYSSPLIAAKCVKSGNKISSVLGCEAQPQGSDGAIANGNHFYVDAGTGVDTATGLSWHDPMATIDAAIALCTAAYGDIIHVAKGHAENVGASGITCDITHMSIIGEGTGKERPLITFITNAAAAVTVTADAVRLENLRFGCNITVQNHMIDVDGDDCQIIDCEFIENGAVPLNAITADTTGGAGHGNDLLVKGCRIYGPTATNWDSGVNIGQDFEGITIEDNYIMGDFDVACIEFEAGANATQDIVIRNNICINEQAGLYCIAVEETALTVTGICANNLLVCSARATCLMPNILNCYGNVWMTKSGNTKPVLLEGDFTTPGQNFYVDSEHTQAVDDAAHGHSWDHPLATLDDAIGFCTTNNGDTIHLAPGHIENVATAGVITVDKIGVTIKGYGNGTNRPTFTFITNTTADIEIDAANVTFENIIFVGDKDALAAPLDVDAAHCTFRNCVFRDLGADNCTDWIVCDANADWLLVEDCVNEGTNTAANASWIQLDGTEHVTIRNNYSHGDFSVANIGVVNTACPYLLITGNHLINLNAVDVNIEGFAGSTGMISKNFCEIPTDTQTTWINTPGACTLFENYGVNQDGEAGLLCGTPSA